MRERLSVIISALTRAGATALNLVGGAVLDLLRGTEPKDLDIEVFGLRPQEIEDAIRAEGLPANTVGRSFGIIKTVLPDGTDVDLSVPRRENKTGRGHRDFQVTLDHQMSAKEAARRRDLTMNSLAYDLLSGKLLDFYGGLPDFRQGILRVTDPETFVEDPLRVLRVAQLLPRKGKRVDGLTLQLCRLLRGEAETLPPERVLEELRKLLLKPRKPAMGLRFLERTAWVSCFPELDALRSVQQNPAWHPEGSVWVHTLLVVNRAAEVRKRVPAEWREAFMWASLLHDVGKAVTTRPDLTSPGHDEAGGPLAEAFMARLRAPKELTTKTVQLVRLHMRPGQLYRSEASEGAWRRLARQAPLEVLGWLSWADSTSRPGHRGSPHGPSQRCFELAERFACEPAEPLVRGRDLLELGFHPGPRLGQALRAAFERQLDGESSRDVLLEVAVRVLQAA